MQGTRSFIDFWLQSEVSPHPNYIFVKINDFFGNSFSKTFLYLILINIVVNFIRAVVFALSSLIASQNLFHKLNNSIIFANMKFFESNPNGRIINRLSNDVLMLDDELPWFCIVTLEMLVYCIGFPVGITIQAPFMIYIAIVCAIGMYLIL